MGNETGSFERPRRPAHPLVGEEEGDRSAALFELPGSLQRLAAGMAFRMR